VALLLLWVTPLVTAQEPVLEPRLPRSAGTDVESSKPVHDPFPKTYADPAVPLLQLPTQFRSRRTTANIASAADATIDILDVTGPGCLRKLWFVFAEKDLDDLEIEINVDGAETPQVRMPFRSFFGTLIGFEDYHIESAGIVTFPNFTITNDPLIPTKASPGWNCLLPIPFATRCVIRLHGKSPKHGAAMVDWQQYQGEVDLTPLRFHAQRHIAAPASPAEPFPILETEGVGFLAGYVMGYRQKDHGDMVFHNSGTRMLIDGETDPHVICGANVEDDFGFSWGFNQYQTPWAGCPHRDNRGRNDQDGVFYRFFGPDPVLFRSSLLFTSNARPDDYEAVSYFYKVPDSKAPRVDSPTDWVAVGLIPDGADFESFKQPADDVIRQLSQPTLPASIAISSADFPLHALKSEHGWLRLEHVSQHRPAYPPTDHSIYARTTLSSATDRRAMLRLAFDDWATVWLNGTKLANLDHSGGFETVRLPVQLRQGENQLVIKSNNRQNADRLIWVIHTAIESEQ
jgi:hypothetical protein